MAGFPLSLASFSSYVAGSLLSLAVFPLLGWEHSHISAVCIIVPCGLGLNAVRLIEHFPVPPIRQDVALPEVHQSEMKKSSVCRVVQSSDCAVKDGRASLYVFVDLNPGLGFLALPQAEAFEQWSYSVVNRSAFEQFLKLFSSLF